MRLLEGYRLRVVVIRLANQRIVRAQLHHFVCRVFLLAVAGELIVVQINGRPLTRISLMAGF